MSRASLQRLAAMAGKEERLIIGLMSGTSLDGLDIALCRVSGSGFTTRFALERFTTRPYDDAFRKDVLSCFARREVDLQDLTLLHVQVAEAHARMVLEALGEWDVDPSAIDLIASHGQTVYHAPRSLHGLAAAPNATLQLGDGDHIAVRTGIVTCSDFRQKHLAAGGEGAPLAAYGDVLLMSHPDKPRLLLNIGGIANFTYLPPANRSGAAFSTDVGPGNTLMDAYVRQHAPPLTFDEDARLARSGAVHDPLLRELKKDRFLALPFPKTTGPEHYSLKRLEEACRRAGARPDVPDMLATLNRFSAEAIGGAVRRLDAQPDIYVSGGGARNPLLREHLAELLPGYRIGATSELGVDPDAKEAILFAVLANELIAGEAGTFRSRIEGGPAVTMGKISLPD